jgi:very-short-patch-repair endonuclease
LCGGEILQLVAKRKGICMPLYNKKNKIFSRLLRNNLTEAERLLWTRIRCKQIKNVQFYRQKPLGSYIVDFYAPSAKIIIEVDGGQHFEGIHILKDKFRDDYLKKLGFKVLRFDNFQVLKSIDDVLQIIYDHIAEI